MSHVQKQIETWDSSVGLMVAAAPGVSEVDGLCGTITTGCETPDRPSGAPGAERHAQWRFITGTEGHGRSWVDKPQQSCRSGSRTYRAWTTCANPAGLTPRLQPVRNHVISAELRPVQTRHQAGSLSIYRLHGREGRAGKSTNNGQSGRMETGQKNAKGSPVAGRSPVKTSRHGTSSTTGNRGIADFVPPWDKTPYFGCDFVPPRVTYIDSPSVAVISKEGIGHENAV